MSLSLVERPMRRIQANGKTYRLRTSYRVVLWCMEVLADDTLPDSEKLDLCLGALVRTRRARRLPLEEKAGLFQAVMTTYVNAMDQKKTGKKVMDFQQDAAYMVAAFRQSYGIDLTARGKDMHWWTFLALLSGLPSDTRMMEIAGIRARPLPKPTKYNREERAQLLRMKSEYALVLSEREKQEQLQDGFRRMAAALTAMAQAKGGDKT